VVHDRHSVIHHIASAAETNLVDSGEIGVVASIGAMRFAIGQHQRTEKKDKIIREKRDASN